MALKSLTGFDANLQRLVNLADGASATDAVTLQQMQAFVRGLSWKTAVRVKTTANVTLSSPGATINGVTMAAGDRFLAGSQTAGAENGIYVWNGAAVAATRALDADTAAKLVGAAVYVTEGTANPDTAWVVQTDPITLGTTTIVFTQFGGGNTYTAGNGLQVSSNAFSILLDTASGLVVSGTGLKVDYSVVTRRFAASCVATTNPQTFTHSLNNADVDVTIKEVSTGVLVSADVTITDANNVSVNFGGAPTAGQYRVIVMG